MTTTLERGTRAGVDLRGGPDRSGSVRVAVLNQPVVSSAVVGTRGAWLQTADLISGIAASEAGLDLLVLSGHGPWHSEPDHLELVAEACRTARVWTAIRAGGSARGMALVDQAGQVVARYGDAPRADRPPRIVDGPGGLRTALTFIGAAVATVADHELRGAELVVALRSDPSVNGAPVRTPARALAWTHSCYVAAANPCGTVGDRHWSGCSLVAGFDGGVLSACGDEECELAVADLCPDELRRARLDRRQAARDLRAAMRRHHTPTHP